MEHFRVDNLWMNRPWLYADQILHHFHGNFTLQGLIDDIKERHPYLVELERLAIRKGTVIHEVFQGAQIGAFSVLAPTRNRYITSLPDFEKTPDRHTEAAGLRNFPLFRAIAAGAKRLLENWDIETLAENTETSASNESCVVQYAVLGSKPVLLTADVGPIGLTEAANYAAQLGLNRPRLVQVPHHGSRHNVTPSVLNRWLGDKQPQGAAAVGTAFCSVGSNAHDYPRAQVTNAFMRRGFKVYSTRTIWISHAAGGGHPGGVPIVAEEFAHEVEGL
ncbi:MULTISPECIES: hypothetical protein [unclassified Variovorax]|nr:MULTISPECIES: hypothetical protein [unclassified Variovorax]PNG45924.1 hypothetical protein CHC06_07902 [Variovorax sp. B2]PNG46190.1 hypothetical protein CHC07_07938 [Variovorax sp. B4]VTV19280.1 hypothetical protein WDL1P3_00202 [Variovorax sp. WDL1]